MGAIFSYRCATCSEVHEGSPSYSFDAPWHYYTVPDKDRETLTRLSQDACLIKDTDHVDYFIRVCLELPIVGIEQPFLWGVWVSVSEDSFRRYNDTWDAPDVTDEYFGWLCNKLPLYPETLGMKTTARPNLNGRRATITLEPTDHPLFVDFHEGLTVARALEMAQQLAHNNPTT